MVKSDGTTRHRGHYCRNLLVFALTMLLTGLLLVFGLRPYPMPMDSPPNRAVCCLTPNDLGLSTKR
jgi:hypothetical protein